MEDSVGSFTRFLLGFVVFLSVSFGLTYAVSVYARIEGQKAETAAAYQAMVGEKE